MSTSKGSKNCFVIGPIGDEASPARQRADSLLKYIITPVATECGYSSIQRADQIADPGLITPKIILSLLDSDLVIADLTDHNPNVFYELAVRHAAQKPLVQLIDQAQQLPFDLAQQRTIHFDIQDLESVERCKDELRAQITAAEEFPANADNPLTFASNLLTLHHSKKPVDQTLGEILSMVQQVNQRVSDLWSLSAQGRSFSAKKFLPKGLFDPADTVVELLATGGIKILGREDVQGGAAVQLRGEGGEIVLLYENGTLVVQGRNQDRVRTILGI